MKRLVSFSLLLLCAIICCNINNSNFITYCNELSETCFVVSDNDYKVVEIYDIDVQDILKKFNVEVTDKIEIDDRTIIEGYSNRLPGGVNLGGRVVNIQISAVGDNCIVGTPLIDGAF